MVAIISNMQKEGVPVVTIPELREAKTSKRHIILTSWASVTTALLIMMFIGGAFYVADLKGRECTTNSKTSSSGGNTRDYSRTYDNDGDETREDFHVDEDDQSELIIKKNKDGNIVLISGIDFRTKISATYIPAMDQCIMLAGTDIDHVDEWSNEKNKTIKVTNEEIKKLDYEFSGNRVTDLSILPNVMRPYCQGKPIFWAQPSDQTAEDTAGRQKRDLVCYHYECYYYWTGVQYDIICFRWIVDMSYCY